MNIRTDRRRFLRASATGGALLGLGDMGFLSRLGPVSADDATLDPKVVRLQPEIEPLVRLLEETPRARLLEEVAARVRRARLTATCSQRLMLAGVRNVPAALPGVGHKFHAVLVVNSAHLASQKLARHRPLAADLLGARLLQEFAGAGRPRGQLDDGAGGRVGRPPYKGPQSFRRGDGQLGRVGGRRGRGFPGPLGRVQRGLRAVLPLRRPRLPLDRAQGNLRGQ